MNYEKLPKGSNQRKAKLDPHLEGLEFLHIDLVAQKAAEPDEEKARALDNQIQRLEARILHLRKEF